MSIVAKSPKSPYQQSVSMELDEPLKVNINSLRRMRSLKRVLTNDVSSLGILDYQTISDALIKLDVKFDNIFQDSLQFVKTKNDVLKLASQLR
jgi:hypothetical protein